MSRNYNRNNKKRYNRSSNRRSGGHSRYGNKTPDYNPMMFVRKAAPQDLEDEYEAKHKFSDFKLESVLKQNISKKGYETPTPIQDQAIQPLLDGKDVIGIAATGTGKTAAFLIPLINKVLNRPNEKVLIVAPTRELAIQVEKELRWFVRGTNIGSAVCIGGVGMGQQINSLRNDPAFVVGTPGRLLDLGKQRKLNFARFSNIVLDEVDRMLDMGFVKDITYLISKLSNNRQSLFFSATLPSSAEKIARQFLKNPVQITVKTQRPSD
jgi:ATP-dependent RNA helicase RhlE